MRRLDRRRLIRQRRDVSGDVVIGHPPVPTHLAARYLTPTQSDDQVVGGGCPAGFNDSLEGMRLLHSDTANSSAPASFLRRKAIPEGRTYVVAVGINSPVFGWVYVPGTTLKCFAYRW
jgi:hypothetical protein